MITPKPIDVAAMIEALDASLIEAGEMFDRHMDSATKTWSEQSKPKWKKAGPKTIGGDRVLTIATGDDPFIFVELGTSAHKIAAKKPGGRLMFQVGGFVPKTAPGFLGSGTGRKGGMWVAPEEVDHPGSEARDFTGVSVRIITAIFPNVIAKNLKF